MDVGITKSNKSHPAHFISGLIVVTIMWSAAVFAIRPLVMGSGSQDGAPVASASDSPARERGEMYANRGAVARPQPQASAGG